MNVPARAYAAGLLIGLSSSWACLGLPWIGAASLVIGLAFFAWSWKEPRP